MNEALIIVAAFAYIAAVFAVVYFVGEKIFCCRFYWMQGYQILLSRKFDAYLFSAIALAIAIPLIVSCVLDKSILLHINALTKWGLFFSSW